VATASGKVAHVGNTAYSGNFIIIDHGLGLVSVYENLSEVLVNSGDEVKIGSLIGKTGTTENGYTFKSGMRFSVCLEGKYINPASNFSGISY
jgi:murein DD-endopeptidase MepM/ murein hydrolase activator NlpD